MANDFAIKGIGLSTYGVGGYADGTVGSYEAAAVGNGANTVVLGNVAYVDLATNSIGDAHSGSFNQTARLADVDTAIKSAEAQGLSVFLKPQLVTNDPSYSQYTSGSWINLVNPNLTISNPDAFFAAYKSYILGWAQIAENNHVTALSIGNEMVAATKPEFTGYWNDIISAIRQVYHGQLTYSALLPTLTDSSSNEVTQIGFWNKLDFAGFDVYPSLATKADPSVAELNAGWHSNTVYGHSQDYYAFVSQMAEQVGKPVVFTETGLPSFQGAADRETSSDGNIGSPSSTNPTAVTDYAEQANWWQSFFQTWMQNKPQWLQGAVVWNNDPEDLGSTFANSYNIIGKPAESVVTSWYGGKTMLSATNDSLAGSQGNDQLYSYGPTQGVAAASKMAATQATIVSVSVTGSLINGHSASFELFVNGHDYGAYQVKPTDSGYVSGNGVHFVTNQTYSVSLAGLQAIDSIKVAWVGDSQVSGTPSTLYLNGASVDGVALAGLTYTSGHGYVQQQQFGNGTSSLWDGGATSIDAGAWNTALGTMHAGSADDPIHVLGNGGTDVLHVLGGLSDYAIGKTGDGAFTLAENSGLGQNLVASGISEVDFQNGDKLLTAGDQFGFSGSSPQLISGSGGGDAISLTGTTGAVVANGGGGADTIVGGQGNDHLYGNMQTAAQGSSDGNDRITVGAGSNYVNGNAGDDVIIVGTAASTGANRLYGGQGNDFVVIHGAGVNSANGNLGNDVLDASDATGNNLLHGGQNDDVLRGGHGQDQLFGDLGNDTLVAGLGASHLQVMTGGSGSDLFDFSSGAATVLHLNGASYYQEITDLDAQADHIHLSYMPAQLLSAADDFASVAAAQDYARGVLAAHAGEHDVVAAAVGGDAFLFYDSSNGGSPDSVVELDHLSPASLSASIFH